MDLLSTGPRKNRRLPGGQEGARALIALALLLSLGGAFVAGALAYRGGLVSAVKRALLPASAAPTPACPVDPVDVPVLEILMGDKAYRQIVAKRDAFLAGGLVMTHDSADFVEAYVRLGDEAQPLKGEVRLTGNMVDRIRDPERWSFRIELDEPGVILGMNEFNIAPPWARDYMSEWYFMQALRYEGLISSRYAFVRVLLNNQDLGIYGLEEHPGAALIANNARPPGPLLRFEQDAFWQEWETFTGAIVTSGGTGSGSLHAAEIRPYDSAAVAASALGMPGADAAFSRQFTMAAALLDAFRLGQASAHEVFDVPLTARFFALTDLMGAWHTLNWNMMRFYFNPLTGLLEPVGLNGYNDYTGASIATAGLLGEGIELYSFPRTRDLHARFFADEPLGRAYARELERLSDPAWLDAFTASVAAEARRSYSVLALQDPQASCSTQVFYDNAVHICKVLNPNTKGMQAHLQSYRAGDADGGPTVTLQVANMQRLPAEVLGLWYNGTALPLAADAPLVFAGRRDAMSYRALTFAWPAGVPWTPEAQAALRLVYHPLGTADSNRHESEVFAWPYGLADVTAGELLASRAPNAEQFAFLQVDVAARVIRLLPGEWTATETIVLPAGYEVRCGPGTTLHLRDGACLISRSPLVWVGTADRPIVVDGDGSGGLLVLQAGLSRLEQVVFAWTAARNGAAPNGAAPNGAAPLRGAVTFCEAPSEWYNSRVQAARGEHALHIIGSSVVLQDTLIRGASADGLCLERSSAVFENVVLSAPGGTALDARASGVRIRWFSVEGAGGVGIWAREGADVWASDVQVAGCAVGLAASDAASLEVDAVLVRDCSVALAAWQGAGGAWGPGTLQATAATLEGNDREALVEVDSTLSLNGALRTATDRDVAARLAPGGTR